MAGWLGRCIVEEYRMEQRENGGVLTCRRLEFGCAGTVAEVALVW